MGEHDELANPECQAILVSAPGEYSGRLRSNADDFANEFELAHMARSLADVDALHDVFE